MKQLFIGLMSGTSMDAIDAVLTDLSSTPLNLIATHKKWLPEALRVELAKLCQPGMNEIEQMGHLDRQMGELFASTVLELIEQAGIPATEIRAIGSHGQTVRHKPDQPERFTLQIADPHTIAAHTGITTVADFRRRDIALGGQGAPLTPAFHQNLFRNDKENRIIVNIGGIANLTWLPADLTQTVVGFDSGPGNTLLDAWINHQQQLPYDQQGQWAAGGQIIPELLDKLLADPYFAKPFPKSTGREHFNLNWLNAHLQQLTQRWLPDDVQTTLTELTAITIIDAIKQLTNNGPILICGGGIKNRYLMQRLSIQGRNFQIASTADYGIDPEWIEAAAFAWLAKQTLDGQPGNLPSVTGATKSSILGAIIPA